MSRMNRAMVCCLVTVVGLLQFACTQSDPAPAVSGYDIVEASTGDLPTAVAVGDLDGDADLDLVVTNTRDGSVSILTNEGAGRFGEPIAYETGLKPKSVALADFDRDGTLDIAVVNSALFEEEPSDVAILLNAGEGEFQQPSVYRPEIDLCSITVGDWNGDEADDVAVTSLSMGAAILMNIGDGSLSDRATYAVEGLAPRSSASGDFDGDADLDLAVVSDGRLQVVGTLSILLNSGDGTFVSGETYLEIGDTPMSVCVADLNNDEVSDLALTGVFNNGVYVLLGKGDGTFFNPTGYVVANSPVAVAAGDLDGDGYSDLITANQLSAAISVIYNRGDGSFGAHQTIAVGNGPSSVAIADLNSDGELDIVVTNQDDDTLSILLSR